MNPKHSYRIKPIIISVIDWLRSRLIFNIRQVTKELTKIPLKIISLTRLDTKNLSGSTSVANHAYGNITDTLPVYSRYLIIYKMNCSLISVHKPELQPLEYLYESLSSSILLENLRKDRVNIFIWKKTLTVSHSRMSVLKLDCHWKKKRF